MVRRREPVKQLRWIAKGPEGDLHLGKPPLLERRLSLSQALLQAAALGLRAEERGLCGNAAPAALCQQRLQLEAVLCAGMLPLKHDTIRTHESLLIRALGSLWCQN